MKSIAAILATAGLGACTDAPPPASPEVREGGDVAPTDCALTISFGSYAMGIDRETLRRVDALLQADRGVAGVTRSPWGREGEVTLCAAVRSSADRERLFAAVAALFPERPRGPLSIRTSDGREAQANNTN